MNKQLIHRDYPEDWDVQPLSSFAMEGVTNFVDGPFGSDLKVSDYSESGVRVLQLQNLGDGYYIDRNRIYTTEAKASQLARCITKPGDIIIAKMADPLARATILPRNEDKYLIVADLIKLRPRDDVNPYYLVSFINFSDFRKEADRLSTGTTRTRISLSTIKRIELPKPPREVQDGIANVLHCADRQIQTTEALIKKYQQIKSGLMHNLFTRGIGADGRLRPPREQAPELYQESPIGWIPSEWGYATIEAIKDSLVDGPFGSNLKTEHYVSDPGVRVVRLQNIQSTRYNDEDKAFVSDRHANNLFRNTVIGNDILIAGLGEERYPVGRACVYPSDLPDAINKADCFRLRCKFGLMSNGFVMYFLNTTSARVQVRKYEQGVTRPRINLGNMNKVIVPCPEIDEQDAIHGKLVCLEEKIETELREKQKLLLKKSGLTHDLLTGKVRARADLSVSSPVNV